MAILNSTVVNGDLNASGIVRGSNNVITTSETDTGETWIDGKKIYRIGAIISVSASSGSAWTASMSVSNLGYSSIWVDMTKTFIHTSNYFLNAYGSQNSGTDFFNYYLNNNNNILYFRGTSAGTLDKLYVVIEYTKA